MPVKFDIQGTYLNVEETAKELGLAEDSVRRYCNQNPQKLRGEKLGGEWYVPIKEVKRYKKERRSAGRPPTNGHNGAA